MSEGAVPPLEAEIAAGFAGAVSRSTGRKIRHGVGGGQVDGVRCECWQVGERVGVQLGDELNERSVHIMAVVSISAMKCRSDHAYG